MKRSFRKVYNLYLNHPILIESFKQDLPLFDSNGVNAINSFFDLENGIFTPTNNLEEVKRALDGKKSLNLQIKMWAETIGKELSIAELKDYISELEYPKWVFKATINQFIKLSKQDPKELNILLLV